MAVGQSIAPSSDITMRIPGGIPTDVARRSIDPTDYMGQSFTYEQWLKAKQKEYESKQQNELDKVLDAQANELPVLKTGKVEKIKTIEDYRQSPEYKKAYDAFIAEGEKAKAEWNATHGPVMGGRFEYKDYGMDRYLKDYNTAKSEVDKSFNIISQAKTRADYEDAKLKYDAAVKKYEEIAKMDPKSDEFKEKYKDEIKEAVNQGIQYASGWGQGGYHGYGAGSIGLRDQLLAIATGSKVGGAIPAVLKSPTETMTDLGFHIDEGSNKWVDATGKEYVGAIPKEYKLVASGIDPEVMKNMLANFNKTGQRPTDEQLTDAAKVTMLSETIKQQNKLMDLSTYAKMFPTDENKAALSKYAAEISDPNGADKRYKEILSELKDVAGLPYKDMTPEITRVRTGSVLGTDIYSSLKGGEYVMPKGKEISLADVIDQRMAAGMTGNYNLYNFPGFGGAASLAAQSEGAKQWLYTTFGDAGKVPDQKLEEVGRTTVEGVSLPIVQTGGREYVKPVTGSLIPLSVVTDLKNLANKSGEYKYNTDTYNREMDYLRSFKNYTASNTTENKMALDIAVRNLNSDPTLTQDKIERLTFITKLGSPLAGTSSDGSGVINLKAQDNVAKGILSFTTKDPLENAVSMGLLPKEAKDEQVVKDIVAKMPKYGDPMIGMFSLIKTLNRNPDVLALDPTDKNYTKTIEKVASASASPSLSNTQSFFVIPSGMRKDFIGPKLPDNYVIPKNDQSQTDQVQVQLPTITPINHQNNIQNATLTNPSSLVSGIHNVNASITNTTGKSPARTGLKGVLIDNTTFKRKGGAFGNLNIPGLTNTTVYRKSKKSKPKADLKGKKKDKKDKSSGLDNLSKNISKFTMSFTGKKKKGKVK
jgi:hypothetical protein